MDYSVSDIREDLRDQWPINGEASIRLEAMDVRN